MSRSGRLYWRGPIPWALMSNHPPNVLILLTDQLQRDAVGAYGNAVARTPHIDQLARDGVSFGRATVACPQCSPSRASMFTGLYAHQHRLLAVGKADPPILGMENRVVLPESVPSMGLAFKRSGYRMGYSGPWHMGDDATPHHGWTDFWRPHRYLPEKEDPYFQHLAELGLFEQLLKDKKLYGPTRARETGIYNSGPSAIPADKSRTAWAVDQAMAFLRDRDDRSWMFCCSIKDPHPPVTPPRDFDRAVSPDDIVLPESLHDDLATKPDALLRCESHRWARNMSEADWRRWIAHYYGLVSHVDCEVGRLLDHLRNEGLAHDTIVVFLADHGESLGAHQMIGKGPSMYQESLSIPFVVHWPGHVESGRMQQDLFSNVDLPATLGGLCGVPVEAGEGIDFSSTLLQGDPGTRREIFSEFFVEGSIRDDFMIVKTIRTDRWKLNLWFYERSELYDLDKDPYELDNRIDDPALKDIRTELAERLLQWMQNTDDPLAEAGERVVRRLAG